MKGYYINLDERTDRREQFEQHNLPVKFERFVPERTKPGWIGCRDAHLALMMKIDSMTMICEDDCEFRWPWSYLETSIKQLPKDWDMLYLSATLTRPVERYSRNLYLLQGGYSNTGYIFHDSKVPQFVLANRDKIIRMDMFMVSQVQPRFNCFITDPLFACQKKGYSDIMGKNFDNGKVQRKRFNKYATKQTIRKKDSGFLP